MESMGKHPALISQKFLLTLYKKNVTKSRKKNPKKPKVSKTAALGGGLKAPGGWEMGPPHTWGMAEGLGPQGMHPSLPSP